MEAKELRIGNLLQENNTETPVQIESIIKIEEGYKLETSTIEGIKGRLANLPAFALSGIPLTEEWLDKFGFEHYTKERHLVYSNPGFKGFTLHRTDKESFYKMIHLWEEQSYRLSTHIKYVHQLQNLYLAVTGKELELRK